MVFTLYHVDTTCIQCSNCRACYGSTKLKYIQVVEPVQHTQRYRSDIVVPCYNRTYLRAFAYAY